MRMNGIAAALAICALVAWGTAAAGQQPKDATDYTKAANAAPLGELPFDDRGDFTDAQEGFIAPLLNEGKLLDKNGKVVYDAYNYRFSLTDPAPDTVNASFWRQSQLNGISGLFRVADRIHQVRGQDVSNITFISTKSGIIVVDPLITVAAAKACLDLYREKGPEDMRDKPVIAVIYTHSHTDHYGGVKGVVDEEDVRAGKVKIFAPVGFLEEAISENVLAGNVMTRRATYSYGTILPKNAKGDIGVGLGVSPTMGGATLIAPTHLITVTGQTEKIEDLTFEFQLTPGSEAPAEMHFYIKELQALCTAENCVHTLHNFYTLRGAKTRDVGKWVGYLNETLDKWGDEAEVLFMPHSWPTWGKENIVKHIELYRDTFKFIHDQSLYLANQGYTINEIGNMLRLPRDLEQNWSSRSYYGSVSHNARAVYNFYLGFFDGNPANLNPYSPAEMGARYVEAFGGVEPMMRSARSAFEKGEYRWTAEILKHVVFADPENRDARELQADAFEQLGYQAECATWRGFYLSGAKELRDGPPNFPMGGTASPDVVSAMTVEMLLDYLAVRLNSARTDGKKLAVNFSFTDDDGTLSVTVANSVLNYRLKPAANPGAEFTLKREDLQAYLSERIAFDELLKREGVTYEGNPETLRDIVALGDAFKFWFNIVTPNAPPKK